MIDRRYLNDALKLAANNQFSPSLDLTEEYNQLKSDVIVVVVSSPSVLNTHSTRFTFNV